MLFLQEISVILNGIPNICFLPTKLPEGAKATLITHEDRKGITCTLLPVQVSQIISFPSREPVTICLKNVRTYLIIKKTFKIKLFGKMN